MKILTTCLNRMDAEIIKSLLFSKKIIVHIQSDDIAGLRPALSLADGVKVLVNEEDYKKAKEIINKWLFL